MIQVPIICSSYYKIDRRGIRLVVEKTLNNKGVSDGAEVVVSVVGIKRMKELHERFMKTSEATDVLSFPLDEGAAPDGVRRLGDIVVCYPVAKKQAMENRKEVGKEVAFLIEHGCMHLLGYHHKE